MQEFFITLFCSSTFSALIVILSRKKKWFINQHDLIGVQKFHEKPTPHIGGLAIYLSFCVGYLLLPSLQEVLLPLLLVSTPVFIIGLIEDLTAKISPFWRLLSIFGSLIVCFFYLGIGVHSLGFFWIDSLLSYPVIGLAFTLLVVGGAVNSLNVVDGYNGLMSGYAILASLAMAIVAHQLSDNLLVQLNLLLVVSVSGFFLLNFPFGKLFMGDGGAYFIGFIFVIIGLLFVNRHDELSNWFVLGLLMYPMYELLFSIFRKKILNDTPASQPDEFHLHMLVHKLIVIHNPQNSKTMNNSKTSPFFWLLSSVSIIPSVFWYDNKLVLIGVACVFMIIYTIIYFYISSMENI